MEAERAEAAATARYMQAKTKAGLQSAGLAVVNIVKGRKGQAMAFAPDDLDLATSQAHQALPPAVREAQARRAGAGPPPPSRAHALAAHTTRTRARYYTTGPQAMAD